MTDLIALLILVLILGPAVAYIVKAKRRGVKCIGCPAGGNCPSAKKMKRKKLDGPVIGKKILKISGHALRSLCDECDHDAEPYRWSQRRCESFSSQGCGLL